MSNTLVCFIALCVVGDLVYSLILLYKDKYKKDK
jgi:hypothetical protein